MHRIECDRFILRSARPEDAASVARHANNKHIKYFLTDGFPHPYHEKDFLNYLHFIKQAGQPSLFLLIEINGEPAGTISASIERGMKQPSAEVGYWLSESYWGQGIMSEALVQLTSYIFEKYPKVRKLYAYIYDFNKASQRTAEKAGYTHLFTFRKHWLVNGQLTDLLYYEITREYYEQNLDL